MVQENSIKPKIIVIIGATATGKSGVAVDLAKKINAEIISTDSVQVYKHFDIGSAKIKLDERKGIIHHNIDDLEPYEEYNVSIFCDNARKQISEILSRKKNIIIVGGTTMYVKALLCGYNFYDTPKTNDREQYLKILEQNGVLFLHNLLKEKSETLASKVHPNNTKRVIRYLEICENNAPVFDSLYNYYDILILNLVCDRVLLYDRINARVDVMLKEGLITEVEQLLKKYGDKVTPMAAIGYREVQEYLSGKTTFEKAINDIKQHSRNYAKRQITFIKTIEQVIDIADIKEIDKLIKGFI